MTDLNALIGNVEEPAQAPAEQAPLSADEILGGLVDNLMALASTVNQMAEEVNNNTGVAATLYARLDVVEKHLAYLLSKDPDLGPKLTSLADKLAEQQTTPEQPK